MPKADKTTNQGTAQGTLPDLSGQACRAIVCQLIWLNGHLTESANVIWIKCNGTWHSFFLEWDVLRWYSGVEGPREDGKANETNFRHVEVSEKFGLDGLIVTEVTTHLTDHDSHVRIAFQGGRSITFRCKDEYTTYNVE